MAEHDRDPQAAAAGALECRVTIVNQRGLHARAAARFVREAEQFDATVEVSNGETTVTGTSIMGLMMLAAANGTEIRLTATGREAAAALDALAKLVADRFDEDC
ncbi:MAG: HPr family phosphocarrier protein [Alphaproteobacteria bacterium]|jgi:phosphocarrier protein HPr